MPRNLITDAWRVIDHGTGNWLCWFRHRTYVLEDGNVRTCARCGRVNVKVLWALGPPPPPPPPDHYGDARRRCNARITDRNVGTKPTSERLVVRDMNGDVVDVHCLGD